MSKTKGEIRFRQFIKDLDEVETDRGKMLVAFKLIESYRGFRYNHIAASTRKNIVEMTDAFGKLFPIRRKNNSVVDLIVYMSSFELNTVFSETSLIKGCFGYDRRKTNMGSKKYADLLRRAVDRNIIKRVNIQVDRQRIGYVLSEMCHTEAK